MAKKQKTVEQRKELFAKVNELIKGGKTVAQACKEVGVSGPTFYAWRSSFSTKGKNKSGSTSKKIPAKKPPKKSGRALKAESAGQPTALSMAGRRVLNPQVTAILNLGKNRTLDLSGTHREVVKTLRQLGSLFG